MSSLTVTNQVTHELRCFTNLRDELQNAFPDLDQETMSDTLEGLTNLRDLLAELIRFALDDETLAAALETRISAMRSRLERLRFRATGMRDLATRTMLAADIKSLGVADFTASIRKGAPALIVQDERQIPAAFWKPQPARLDRQALLAALKGGAVIDGVTLSGVEFHLSVRTK